MLRDSQVTQKPNDGGIHSIINEDSLDSDDPEDNSPLWRMSILQIPNRVPVELTAKPLAQRFTSFQDDRF